MQPLQQQDESLASSTTKAVSALLDAHACSICHDLLSAPVALPCSHIFCSECVRRHLSTKSFCPHPTCRKPTTYMQLTPLRGYDVSLEPLRQTGERVEPVKLGAQKRLVFLSRKACSRAQLIERLRAHGLPTHGGADAIANRYNEFVLRWNANLDAGVAKSKKSIVAAVMATGKGAGKESRRLRSMSSFFRKAPSTEGKLDVEAPTEGDDFSTLVKKTKARMESKRKLAMAAQQSDKRICLTKAGSDSEVIVNSQGKLGSDCNSGDALGSQLPDGRVLSQPGGIQRNLTHGSNDNKTSVDQNPSNVLKKAHASPHCLSIQRDVCELNIASEEAQINTGSLPRPSTEEAQRVGHSMTNILPHGPMWSQTTPEKRIVTGSGEQEANISDKRNDAAIALKPLPWTNSFMQALHTNAHSNPYQNSANLSPHSSAVVVRRPRTPETVCSPPKPLEYMKIEPQEPPPQSDGEKGARQESKHPSEQNISYGLGDADLTSKDVIPTIAQLERAERNRLAAIAKRKRFYERRNRSGQIRQPEL